MEGVSRDGRTARFVARLLDGEKMAPLCAEFGISRKTGYKIYDRYKDVRRRGVHGSEPASVSPGQSAAVAFEELIVRLKREYPGWGAPKIREKLRQQSTAPHLRLSARSMPCWIGTGW